MSDVGRNAPCPCGSGKKYKRCCLRKQAEADAGLRETKGRELAIALLHDFMERFVPPTELDEAAGQFWSRRPEAFLKSGMHQSGSLDAFNGWLWFDRELEDGTTPAEAVLRDARLTPEARRYLERMSTTSMQPWEVVDVVPGTSMTLHQPLQEIDVTVGEATASRRARRGSLFAARINPLGPSGGPELDCGFLEIPMPTASRLLQDLAIRREEYLRTNRGRDLTPFYKSLAPIIHDAWLSAFDPVLPDIINADGEIILPTAVSFRVEGDAASVASALDAHDEFEPSPSAEPGNWLWKAGDTRGRMMPQGDIVLNGDELRLNTLTKEAAARGRALLESLTGGALLHSHTTHESIEQRARSADDHAPAPDEIDPALAEALLLEFQEQHYRHWLDDEIPALGGATPREAAERPKLRPQLESLIRGLEGRYEEALRDGSPAYDPSWMWAELGLVDEDDSTPPLLANERWADEYQWDDELSELAAAVRSEPGYDEKTRLIELDEVRHHLGARQLLREIDADFDELAPILVAALNHELHRRRTFWVSESLAFMLQKTDTDVVGRDLRLPFPSFAMVFTDRATLSLGERLMQHSGLPMSGYMLRVLTVFVRGDATETDALERTLSFDLAFDTLGEGAPAVVQETLEVRDDEPIFEEAGEGIVWTAEGDDEERVIAPIDPRAQLAHTIVNAILYATSAGVEPVLREPRRTAPSDSDPSASGSNNGALYYLPGKISISHLRNLEAIERSQGGGQLMHRFMVRGHWRRANPNWKDQRMRWIEPYWKGPDLATVIERQYQLGPQG